MMLNPEACSRAVSSRDPRFDGVFFVGITVIYRSLEREARQAAP